MDIKRTNPGQVNWKPGESDSVKRTDRPSDFRTEASPSEGARAAATPFDSIKAEFKRADLNTAKFDTILNRSVSALLDSASERMGGIPQSAREKIAGMLAADPIFARRVSLYLEKNLE